MELAQKEFEKLSKQIKEFEKFFKENEELLLKYHQLEENLKVANFKATERIQMFLDEGKIKIPKGERKKLEDDILELRISSEPRFVQFFQKKFYLNNKK